MYENTTVNSKELFGLDSVNGGRGDDLVECLLKEDWTTFFENTDVKNILNSLIPIIQNSDDDNTSSSVDEYIAESKNYKELFWLGIACLRLFLQENWTGPPLNLSNENLFSEELNNVVVTHIEKSGEELRIQSKYPSLIFLSKSILCNFKMQNTSGFPVLPFWSVKCLSTYLGVVEEANDENFSTFKQYFTQIQQRGLLTKFSMSLQAEFYLDSFHIFLQCYDYENCKFCLEEVKKHLKIEYSLTGALGKRTKFQEFDLPQMKLDIKKWNKEADEDTLNSSKINKNDNVPNDILLEEESLLPDIKFIDGEEIKNADLSPIEQAFALTSCIYLQKTRPQDKLTHEEILPFITQVLMLPQCWCVQYESLLLRCIVEFKNSRKAERALQQLESLLQLYNKDTPNATERLHLLNSVGLNPYWESKRKYAHLLLSLGMVDSALEIFLPLKLWDDVILCYQGLGKHGKAEKIIRDQLETRESALLWNLLGDVTMDMKYYEKAWEFSGHRNARSQRSMGLLHLRKDEFEQAIPYLQKSLELSHLQPGIAFSLGCCCMRTGDVKAAAKSFQHCVSLDPDNAQAWSNLSSNFIRMNQLQKAYKALQEATRLSYDNWKIWENFFLVCADVGAFEDCLLCIHRLIDIGRKEIDTQALVVLTDAVLTDEVDFKGIQAGRLKQKLLKCFGHVTSKITNDALIWELYSKVCYSETSHEDQEKALQLLYKSHRCYTMNTTWENSPKSLPSLMNVTSRMVQATFTVCRSLTNQTRSISLYTTTKLSVNNLLTRLQNVYTDEKNEISSDIVKHIDTLKDYVNTLDDALHSIK